MGHAHSRDAALNCMSVNTRSYDPNEPLPQLLHLEVRNSNIFELKFFVNAFFSFLSTDFTCVCCLLVVLFVLGRAFLRVPAALRRLVPGLESGSGGLSRRPGPRRQRRRRRNLRSPTRLAASDERRQRGEVLQMKEKQGCRIYRYIGKFERETGMPNLLVYVNLKFLKANNPGWLCICHGGTINPHHQPQSSLVYTLPITKKNKRTVVTEAPEKVHALLYR